MSPAAAVCVSTYNRAERLERLLGSLAAQDFSDFEVVVYDDASSDWTVELLRAWEVRLPLTVLVGTSNRGPAVGRNAAWRAATAPLVLFTDDDCVPHPGWVRAHVDAAGPVTVGRTVPAPDQHQHAGPFSRTLTVESPDLFHTCNIGYPREVLVALDGFDDRYRRAAGEDTDLGLRAERLGVEAVFVPEAVVEHDIRPSSWTAALKETGKWVDVPLFVALHGTDSAAVYSRWWWRKTHPVAAAAAVGVLLAPWHRWALLAALPWLRLRTGEQQVHARRRHWPWVLPAQLAVDVAEVAVLARGSVRHRRLLL